MGGFLRILSITNDGMGKQWSLSESEPVTRTDDGQVKHGVFFCISILSNKWSGLVWFAAGKEQFGIQNCQGW